MKSFGVSATVLTILAVLAICSPVQAQGGCHWWSYPYPADLTPLYSVGAIPTPPYFALHPPVYYDMPVPRTYGYGPWAYPPYMTTPEIEEPEPQIIENKYVPKPIKSEPEPQKMAVAPLRILNPYVVGPTGSVAAK